MRKIITLLAIFSIVISACSKEQTYTDFIDSGKRIAVEAGDIYGDLSLNLFKSRTQEYTNTDSMLAALRNKNVDAILIGDGFVRRLENSGHFPEFDYIRVPEYIYVNKAAHIFHDTQLRDKYNEWFASLVANGILEEILDRWLGGELPESEDIPTLELTGENGTLRVCDTGNYAPLSYYDNGVLVGFDMEMARRFAQFLGMDLEVTIVDYEAIGDYVQSGKVDMSAATWAITAERESAGEIIFGEPCLITEAVLIVNKRQR